MSSSYSRGQTGKTQAQPAPFVVTLTVRRGPDPGRKYVVSKERMTLGRQPAVEVPIEHRQVSPRHASIVREGDRLVLRDLGSVNGTTVNDAPLTGSYLLRSGDIIGLGDVELLFQVTGGPRPPAQLAAGSQASPPQPATGPQSQYPGSGYDTGVMASQAAASGDRPPSSPAPPPRPRSIDWSQAPAASARPAKPAGKTRWPMLMVAGCAAALVVICLVAAVAFFALRQLPAFAAAPELTVIQPSGGLQVVAGQPVQVVASARDPRGVTRAELWVNGELDSLVESDVPGGQRLLRMEQPWTPGAMGDYDIQLKVYNSAGKVSESDLFPVTVMENKAPQPTVVAQAAPTATPVVVPAAPTPAPPPTVPPPTPAPAPAQADCSNDAAFAADVTVPDNSPFERGAGFSKTWRIRNSGTCAWDESYKAAFISGSRLNAPESQPVPATAAGGSVDITVDMQAPGDYGSYRGLWQMVDSRGEPFGQPFSVVIQVPAPAEPTPVPQPTEPPKPVQAISLTADNETIRGGDCTNIHANAEGVAAAWLDGEPVVGGKADKQVCPCEETTYALDVKMPNDEMKRETVTIKVDGDCTANNPDLVIRDFNIEPKEFKVGDKVRVRVRVKNQGGVDADGFRLVWKPYGDDLIKQGGKSDLKLGNNEDVWIEWDYKYEDEDKTGEFDSQAIVDADNKVKEADEGNNDKRREIKISK